MLVVADISRLMGGLSSTEFGIVNEMPRIREVQCYLHVMTLVLRRGGIVQHHRKDWKKVRRHGSPRCRKENQPRLETLRD